MRKAALAERLGRCEDQVEALLREAAEARRGALRLTKTLERLPQAVVITDDDGSPCFESSAAAELLRPGPTGSIARRAVEEAMAAARTRGEVTETLVLHGPPARTLEVSAGLLHDGAIGLGTVCVVDDVSERRQLDAVRRDFVANVSHELRTPVGALSVLAETMAEEDDPATLRRLAVRVGIEANRARRLIDDLLDLSRIEAEGLRGREPVVITDVIAAAVDRVRELAGRNHTDISIADHTPIAVAGDERQLVTALANLLDNAVKYSEEGGAVEIAVRGEPGWVEVDVVDQGPGIPTRDLERVFERFYRVDQGRSRDTGGTGLGLAIVRHVALNHGGDVRVSSREGEGATFTLRLPKAQL